MMRWALATALAAAFGLAACGDGESSRKQAEVEAALATFVQQQSDETPLDASCSESGDGWDCEVELRNGETISCGADGEHPEFSCIE
jgi:hypothetical protein